MGRKEYTPEEAEERQRRMEECTTLAGRDAKNKTPKQRRKEEAKLIDRRLSFLGNLADDAMIVASDPDYNCQRYRG